MMPSRFLAVALVLVAACSTAHHDSASAERTQQAEVRYTAIGDSTAAGIGSRVPCMPFKGCDSGTSYVGVLARRLRATGPVRLTNMGTPGAVLSPTIDSVASDHGVLLPGNFVDDEMPRVPPDATLVTIFGGGNDVNALVRAIDQGAGAGDVDGYVNEQVEAFGRDCKRLVAGVRARAPQARIVVMNLPNFASLPYRSNDPPAERDLIGRISTGFSRATNALTAENVVVVDLMCDARIYEPANFAPDGFHPNDHGYELLAEKLFGALGEHAVPPPASCPQMTAAGRSG